MIRSLVSFALISVLTAGSLTQLREVRSSVVESTDDSRGEVLYLPDGTALQTVSFGFDNFVADILWFNTISYFGKHFKSDRNYEWLNHMCHLVTDLDPRAYYVFEFCGTMLAWEANEPKKAYQILTKAMEAEPDRWNYPYLRGFTSMYFLEDPEAAREDFVRAAALPNAEPFVARLAAQEMVLSDPDDAVRFLSEMIENAQDPSQRAVLEDKLREVVFERDADVFRKAVEIYEAKFGKPPSSLEEVINDGIIQSRPGLLQDPFGGRFLYNREAGRIESSTGRRSRGRQR